MGKNKQITFLETEKIGRLMKKYAIPCIISLLVAALYNIVDQIFIANADYLGSYGNAANTVVFPLTVIALAVAVMIGDGCCAFVSISLGKKDTEKAHRSIGNSIIICIIASVIITAVYLAFSTPIINAFGGSVNEKTFEHSEEYFFWITLGIPFYMFGQAMNPVIRSDGSPKFAMISTLAGAVINIILDPVCIFIFKWGMAGAAIATVIGQIATALVSIWYLFHTKTVKLNKNSFRLDKHILSRCLSLGACSFLAQISLVAAMAAINNMVCKYSAEDVIFSQTDYAQIPMAVLGIVMKFFQIIISISIGTAAGCIPIVGYNTGAKRPDRTRELFTKLIITEAIVGFAALLIVELVPQLLIQIFGAGNESIYYTEFAVKAFRIYLCMLPLATVNKATFIFLQSLGKPWTSTFLSMLREVILGVGLAIILPVYFSLDGVLYSMPTADIITFAVSLIIIIITYKNFNREIKAIKQNS